MTINCCCRVYLATQKNLLLKKIQNTNEYGIKIKYHRRYLIWWYQWWFILMLGTKVKAWKLFLKIKCYIAEKSRAVGMVFRRNFLSVLHLNLVSSPIKGILEILYLTTRCILMDILAWTDCVRSSAGKIS
jgi:hypothetical protein